MAEKLTWTTPVVVDLTSVVAAKHTLGVGKDGGGLLATKS